ncbi:MAG: hypothetical protein HY848_05010 [Betaproteobacteria bacterium]|nr:hypothetical protein [Betaproteobacteria bacterium]
MAKKARKKSAAKRGKKSKLVKKTRARAKKKSKPAPKKKAAARKAKRKSKQQSIGDRVANAYHTVVDTVKDTDRLRNKIEPPGTSETS